MGGAIAAQLVGSVGRLVVLDTNEAHVERIREQGLTIDSEKGSESVPLEAVADATDLSGHFDFALVTVKSPFMVSALQPLADRGGIDAFVSLGNGLVEDLVASVVGADRVIGGVMEFGATNVGPGLIRRTAGGAVAVGEIDGVTRERTTALFVAMRTVDEIELSRHIRDRIWSKLMSNIVLSGLSAISGSRTGAVCADPNGIAAAVGIAEEGFSVAQAHGVNLDPNFGADAREYSPREVGYERAEAAMRNALTTANGVRPSMLQDLDAGRPTEVDVISGALVEEGRKVDYVAAANETVVRLVHEIESGDREPGPTLLREVAEAARQVTG